VARDYYYYSNNNNIVAVKVIVVVVVMYKYNIHFTDEITLLIAKTVNTEQLQHYIQVYNCKYPA